MSASQNLQLFDGKYSDSEWLTTWEAAAYLRIVKKDGSTPCIKGLRNFTIQKRIPYYKPFGRLLFKRSELQRFIESSRSGV